MIEDTETPTEVPSPPREPERPRQRGNGLAIAAIIVAIIALGLGAWSTWQWTRAQRAGQASHKHVVTRLGTSQTQVAANARRAKTDERNLAKLKSSLDGLHTTVESLGRRTTNLEIAVANLHGQPQSAHDALLLNDAAMLLRVGEQRFELFHDTQGALKAYTQAVSVLGQVQNPVFAPVRASAITERDALAAAAPPSRQSALDTLSALRGKIGSLPLRAPGAAPVGQATGAGFWGRVKHAFSGFVTVSRDTGNDTAPPVEGQFARQALALDLAQAQEALLTFDRGTCRRSLERAAKLLVAQFDTHDKAVQTARSQIGGLLARTGFHKAPKLGDALAQLRSLRAHQASVLPAPAATSGQPPTVPLPALPAPASTTVWSGLPTARSATRKGGSTS